MRFVPLPARTLELSCHSAFIRLGSIRDWRYYCNGVLQRNKRVYGTCNILHIIHFSIHDWSLDVPDFYFTGDDYRYRFDLGAKRRFIDRLRARFNSDVNYKGRVLKWDTVIQEKTTELSRFLIGKSQEVNFMEPCLILERSDDLAIRKRILSLSQEDAGKLGIEKSTLHYLRKKAGYRASFQVYTKVRERLETPVTTDWN